MSCSLLVVFEPANMAARIRNLRQLAGVAQGDLARAAGMSQKCLSERESGKVVITASEGATLAELIDTIQGERQERYYIALSHARMIFACAQLESPPTFVTD